MGYIQEVFKAGSEGLFVIEYKSIVFDIVAYESAEPRVQVYEKITCPMRIRT